MVVIFVLDWLQEIEVKSYFWIYYILWHRTWRTLAESDLEASSLRTSFYSSRICYAIFKRIHEVRETISGLEDTIEENDIFVKEHAKYKKILTQNIQEIWDTTEKWNLRIVGIEGKYSHLKGSENIFNKIRKENIHNLKKEKPLNGEEGYGTPNILDQKRKSPRHIIIKP